ncbi:DNA mismatch repair endonuclease MutL [Gallaecimonas sp. GXIMD4217]|uniref:DNA mismatch repair endonuclease MutL n=1 Tax=Gallaecimonas sp. GXIMD4217 TaxID=3131927 RepID=UPI00311AFB84
MPIQILPPRLANQIAAGEVVERPASVVKELVENSLDAGARRIEIDIEKGGHRLIRIRDDGSGIPRGELTLALSRHATSKIAELDDLEHIVSLGFRGEALASISSVSRLTLTSRTADQDEAWQAQAEGRDMAVTVKPAAHPKGTTLEVHDLFFNTPARRKFLRAEKTEFAHIDEVVRRIALSRFDVTLLLRHNGKTVRSYRAARHQDQESQRVAAVCGQAFIKEAVRIDCQHHDLQLTGWLGGPGAQRNHPDLQYCYVNGRMMKDKLIQHAVKEAFGPWLAPGQFPAYVLFLSLDPAKVDVNVHPAKHEVRFHEARLVHDFLLQALKDGLEPGQLAAMPGRPAEARVSAGIPAHPGQDARLQPAAPARDGGAGYASRSQGAAHGGPSQSQVREQLGALAQWVPKVAEPTRPEPGLPASPLFRIEGGRFLLTLWQQQLRLFSLPKLLALALGNAAEGGELSPQPLLLPVSVPLSSQQLALLDSHRAWLARLGLELAPAGKDRLLVRGLPGPLREWDASTLVPALLEMLAGLAPEPEPAAWPVFHDSLARALLSLQPEFRLAEASRLWQSLQDNEAGLAKCSMKVDLNDSMKQLERQ